jgi:hypothetical protein
MKKILSAAVLLLSLVSVMLSFTACRTPNYNLGKEDKYRLGQSMVSAIANAENSSAKQMIKAGAPLNFQDKRDEWTPLMYAIYYENWDMAEYLIDAGSDVNLADNQGRTALMFAAMRGNLTVLRMLIDRHADLNATDNVGRNALSYAVIHDENYSAKFLAQVGYIAKENTGDGGKGQKVTPKPAEVRGDEVIDMTKPIAPLPLAKPSSATTVSSSTSPAAAVAPVVAAPVATAPAAKVPAVPAIAPSAYQPVPLGKK